jgi:thiamine-phosphate pyrophosphorylase
MALNLTKPILYLITAGLTSENSTPESKEFQNILELVSAAAEARVSLLQLREKDLTPLQLFELAKRAAEITRGTATRLLVNDRADVAAAAGADGVHLTTRSIEPRIIRNSFGQDFLIGCSTHSLSEAAAVRDADADFAVLGPVFETGSKAQYGAPLGLEKLAESVKQIAPFPIIALGGVSRANAVHCLRAGAAGVAGISLFSDGSTLKRTVDTILKITGAGQEC